MGSINRHSDVEVTLHVPVSLRASIDRQMRMVWRSRFYGRAHCLRPDETSCEYQAPPTV